MSLVKSFAVAPPKSTAPVKVTATEPLAAVAALVTTPVAAPAATAVTSTPETPRPAEFMPLPTEPTAKLIVSPEFEPTWKAALKLPSSSFLPLKVVVLAIRSSSDFSWLSSDWMLPLASVFMPPSFAAWTDRSRMRWRMLCVSVSAPSAVCTTEMPSWVLRTATFRPPICERRPSEMASPAASSAARLIRKPEESFSSDLLIWPSVTDRLRYALSAAMLLLTRRPTDFPPWKGTFSPAASVQPRPCCRWLRRVRCEG